MDRSTESYESAIRDLDRYVKDPKNERLSWNTLTLVRDYKSTCNSLGRDAREALEKYEKLDEKYRRD